MSSFPANPSDGMLVEFEDGSVYQYDVQTVGWLKISSGQVSAALVTGNSNGLLSPDDLRKLNRLVIPPLSTLIGNECTGKFVSGFVSLYGGDDYVKVTGESSVKTDTGFASLPSHLHQHTYSFDFGLDVNALLAELDRRGQLKLVGKRGSKGKKGIRGLPGVDAQLVGPRGETGARGEAPPCTVSLERETYEHEVKDDLRLAIVAARIEPDVAKPGEYKLILDRQAIRTQSSASRFNVKQQSSSWVLAVASGAAIPQVVYYVDLEPLVTAIHQKFLSEVERLKAGYEDVVDFWVQTMSDLFDEQKRALCCALEFCHSKTKNIDMRQHMESVAGSAAGNANIKLNNRNSRQAVKLPGNRMLRTLRYPDSSLSENCGTPGSFPTPTPTTPPGPGPTPTPGDPPTIPDPDPPTTPPVPVPTPTPVPIPTQQINNERCAIHGTAIGSGMAVQVIRPVLDPRYIPGTNTLKNFLPYIKEAERWLFDPRPYDQNKYDLRRGGATCSTDVPMVSYRGNGNQTFIGTLEFSEFSFPEFGNDVYLEVTAIEVSLTRSATALASYFPLVFDTDVTLKIPDLQRDPTRQQSLYRPTIKKFSDQNSNLGISTVPEGRYPVFDYSNTVAGTPAGHSVDARMNNPTLTTPKTITLGGPAYCDTWGLRRQGLNPIVTAEEIRKMRVLVSPTYIARRFIDRPGSQPINVIGVGGGGLPGGIKIPDLQNGIPVVWDRFTIPRGMMPNGPIPQNSISFMYFCCKVRVTYRHIAITPPRYRINTETLLQVKEPHYQTVFNGVSTPTPWLDKAPVINPPVSISGLPAAIKQVTGTFRDLPYKQAYVPPELDFKLLPPFEWSIIDSARAGTCPSTAVFESILRLANPGSGSLAFNEFAPRGSGGTASVAFKTHGITLPANAVVTGVLVEITRRLLLTKPEPVGQFNAIYDTAITLSNGVKRFVKYLIPYELWAETSDQSRWFSSAIGGPRDPWSYSYKVGTSTSIFTTKITAADLDKELILSYAVRAHSATDNARLQIKCATITVFYTEGATAQSVVAQAAAEPYNDKLAVWVDAAKNINPATAANLELPAGRYRLTLESMTANFSGLYGAQLIVAHTSTGKKQYSRFMDKGKFKVLAAARSAYEGLVIDIEHEGGFIAAYFDATPSLMASGSAVLTVERLADKTFIEELDSSPVCGMDISHLEWYEKGWETGHCCGFVTTIAGQDYIIIKRSVGTDHSCGGGEQPTTPCLEAYHGQGHPAFAWPTLDGVTFAPASEGVIRFSHIAELNQMVIDNIEDGQVSSVKGTQTLSSQLVANFGLVLFPLAN